MTLPIFASESLGDDAAFAGFPQLGQVQNCSGSPLSVLAVLSVS